MRQLYAVLTCGTQDSRLSPVTSISPRDKRNTEEKKKKNMDLGVLTSWPKFLFKKRKQEILSIL